MKKVILIITLIFFGLSTQAQKKKRNTKLILEVDGICMMCKKRIEKAALKSKGVKSANYNIDKKELFVIIDERKTDKKTLQQTIANIGHDTKDIKAPQEIYDNLHGCCKYRDEEIINQHKKKK